MTRTIIELPDRERPNIGREIAIAALDIAISELGLGESIANNSGPYVWSLTGRKTSGAWCAAAVYSWYERGAEEMGYQLAVSRTHSARKLAHRIASHGRWIPPELGPQRGDVALWKRGLPWQGHVGIVRQVLDGGFRCVEGNVGKFPAVVRTRHHTVSDRKLLGFARYY